MCVGEYSLPRGTPWLLKMYWGRDFYTWVRLIDGALPTNYTQLDGPYYPTCSPDADSSYWESSKAVRAFRLSEITRSKEAN